MLLSTENIGLYIRKVRKELGVTQRDLALTAGTGLRFIIELENGKPTCQIGKTLQVLQVLGVQLQLSHPELENENHKLNVYLNQMLTGELSIDTHGDMTLYIM